MMEINYSVDTQLFKEFKDSVADGSIKGLTYPDYLSNVKLFNPSDVERILLFHQTQNPPDAKTNCRRQRRCIRRYVDSCKELGVKPNLPEDIINKAYKYEI